MHVDFNFGDHRLNQIAAKVHSRILDALRAWEETSRARVEKDDDKIVGAIRKFVDDHAIIVLDDPEGEITARQIMIRLGYPEASDHL